MFKLKTAFMSFALLGVLALCTVTAKAQTKVDTLYSSVDTLDLAIVDTANHLAVTAEGDTINYSSLVDAEIKKAVLDAVSTVLTEGSGKPWQWWIGQAVGLVFLVGTIYFANRSEKFRKLYQEVNERYIVISGSNSKKSTEAAPKTKQHIERARSSTSGKFVKKQ